MTVLPPITRIAGQSASAGSGPPQSASASAVSGVSQRKVTWLRSRKRRISVQIESERCPTTIARGGGGSAAMPCRPRIPPMRCCASRPTSRATSGDREAMAW